MSLCASTASPAPHLEQRPCAPPVTGPCQNPSEGSQCMLAPQTRGECSVDERVGRSGGFFSPVGEVWSRGGLVAQVHPRRLCSAPAPWHCEAQPQHSFCCILPMPWAQETPEPGSETPSPPCRGAAAAPAAGTRGRRSSTGWWPCRTATTSPPSLSWTPPRCRRRIPSSHGTAARSG